MNIRLAALFSIFCLGACGAGRETIYDYKYYLANKGAGQASTQMFDHCRSYGCKVVDSIVFYPEDWSELESIFTPPSRDAAQERARISMAVGWFERKVGAINGTAEDIRGTFEEFGEKQHDCVDESTNTTIYLSLMDQQGFLLFHRIRLPHMRAPFFGGGGWPHLTAVITETAGGKEFAVDSWFENNGEPAHIVDLEVWENGWRPGEDKTIHCD